jgi:hypothetical protein
MAKTRHRNPRTALRYVKPGPQAIAEVTDLLDIAHPGADASVPTPRLPAANPLIEMRARRCR